MQKEDKKFKARKATQKYDINGFWVRIFKLLKPSHKQVAGLLMVIVFLEMSRFVGPYILKMIVDAIANFSSAEIGRLFLLAAAMFAANELTAFIVFFQDRRIFRIIVDAENYLSRGAFSKMLGLQRKYLI